MRAKLLAFTMLLSLSAAKLTAGEPGYVHCRSGETYVYLYQSPDNFQVVANLKCDQQIEVDSQNGAWARVRTADGKEGYLPQASLAQAVPNSKPQNTAPQSAAPQGTAQPETPQQGTAPQAAAPQAAPHATEPPPSPKSVNSAAAPAASVRVPLTLDESDTPRFEVAGGYSFLNEDTSGLSAGRQNVNGFESSFTYNVTRRLGAEGNFSGYFQSQSENSITIGTSAVDLGQREYGFAGGPRYNAGLFFIHGLLGMDRISLNLLGSQVAQNSIAVTFGGGAEWKFSRHLAIRASGDWIYSRHNLDNLIFPGGPAYMQNNVRISVGIAYRAGSVSGR